eukprot:3585408-Rhodomonas_salina.1
MAARYQGIRCASSATCECSTTTRYGSTCEGTTFRVTCASGYAAVPASFSTTTRSWRTTFGCSTSCARSQSAS